MFESCRDRQLFDRKIYQPVIARFNRAIQYAAADVGANELSQVVTGCPAFAGHDRNGSDEP
jgi:hypothetical protein